MSAIDGKLGVELNFFPLIALQLGGWLSAFHTEGQLFMFTPKGDKLVFLAVHPKDRSNMSTSTFIPLARKKLLKHFGKNSPFAVPKELRKNTQDKSLKIVTLFEILKAEYWGVTAFEVPLSSIVGLDYCNTLVTYGSRIVIEAPIILKKWFPDAHKFCRHYRILHMEYEDEYYKPALDYSQSYFITRQMYPKDSPTNSATNSPLPKGISLLNSLIHKSATKSSVINSFRSSELDYIDTEEESSQDRKLSTVSEPCENLWEEESIHKEEIRNQTLVAYFDDPVIPFYFRDLVKKPENKQLLRMYERGIPAWAVFLPSYGLPYRPWMRSLMAFLIFCVSLVTMLLGFYDLYKYIPMLRESLHAVFGSLFETFEQAFTFRLSCLLGYMVATSKYFEVTFSYITYPFNAIYYILEVSTKPLQMFIYLFQPIYSMLYSIFYIVMMLFVHLKDVIMTTLSIPIEVISFLLYMIKDLGYGTYSFIKGAITALRSTSQVIKNNQEAAMTSIGMLTRMKDFWQNVLRQVLKGVTSVYNFTVYTSYNLYKHKESTWISLEQYYKNNKEKIHIRMNQAVGLLLFYVSIRIASKYII
jgi:hypothetical protein